MSRDVIVKASWTEVGVGSINATPLWESTPTKEGAIVRLDQTENGKFYVTFTDAEEFDGAYVSVQVTIEDLAALWLVITGEVKS